MPGADRRAAAPAKEKKKDPGKILANNPSAGHLYHLQERFEAGLALVGTEVKAVREGRVQLKEAFVSARGGEMFLFGCHIGAYSHTGYATHEPTRPRKLLLHKQEIRKLTGKLTLRGLTVVPIKMYTKAGRVKLEIALAEGKKLHDKREAKQKKDVERDVRRAMKER